MHDPLTWKLNDTCGVHHVSTDRGHDIFMLVEKDYPLTRGILTLMLCNKLQVDQYSEMANELLKKIFILANRPRQGGSLGIKGFYKFLLLVQLSTAKRRLSTAKLKIQGRHEHDMEFDFDLDAAKDVSTAEKDVSTVMPVSTAGATITTTSVAVSTAKDKGKAKMDESEYETAQTKTKLQQEQERLGYKAAVRLQAELEEEERQRISRVHKAASSFNGEEWEAIQARVEADEELAQRLQAEEREMYTEAEQARILHMGGYTLQQLRGYSFDEIKNLFETTIRRVHTFVPIESEIERVIPKLAAGSLKRDAEEELDQESSKRQKTGESSELAEEPIDKEADELSQEELQQMMIIVPEQGMNVEALQTKYPIIDWEIYIEGTRKDDLVMLWSLIKEKFNSTEPTDDKEREIWVELKRLFKPDIDDELWKLQKHIHD
ncbi:hypothetical protein Tco_0243132 [Tanacetum coccineum]